MSVKVEPTPTPSPEEQEAVGCPVEQVQTHEEDLYC